jgi:hypothetical protein
MQQFVGEEKNDLLDYLRSLKPEKVYHLSGLFSTLKHVTCRENHTHINNFFSPLVQNFPKILFFINILNGPISFFNLIDILHNEDCVNYQHEEILDICKNGRTSRSYFITKFIHLSR